MTAHPRLHQDQHRLYLMPVVAECELHKRIQKAVQLVGRRALALPTEYANKARHADRTYCRTPVGSVGPTEQKLLTFEPVRGLVFGAWGEASPEVSKLLNAMARAGARRHWRGMRCREPSTATGVLAWMLRRRWGLTALRENARLKLDRLQGAHEHGHLYNGYLTVPQYTERMS